MRELQDVLAFLHMAEGLKRELRHSWLSDGRQESVAEHSWRVALMVVLLDDRLGESVDRGRLLRMIVVHDLIEVIAGDVPAFDSLLSEEVRREKAEKEHAAILQIRDRLPGRAGDEVYALWIEFEEKESEEAKIANALDKLEAQIQHNEASLDTWLPIEYEMTYKLGRHTAFHEELDAFRKLVEDEGDNKINSSSQLGSKQNF